MDVRLVEPETARPQEPRQEGVRREVIVGVGLVTLALVFIIFLGYGGQEKPVEAAAPEPIITSSASPLLFEGERHKEDDLLQVLEQGMLEERVEEPLQPEGASAWAMRPPTRPRPGTAPAQSPVAAPQPSPQGNPWASAQQPAYGASGGSRGGSYGYRQSDPREEQARQSDPVVFQHGRGVGGMTYPLPAPPERQADETPKYLLLQGSVIPAMTVSGIDSERPGIVLAQVTRDVFDARVERVLIPQGSRLVGSFENLVQADQEHVVLAWSRLVFPDGTFLDLKDFSAMEASGESGLSGRVSRPYGRAVRDLALLSAFGVASAVASGQLSGADDAISGFVVFQLVGQLLEAGKGLFGLGKPLQARVRVPAGYRFNAYVGTDLPLPKYWVRKGAEIVPVE